LVRDVSSSPVLKIALPVLLLVTLGWKLAVRPGGPNELSEGAFQHRVAEFLVRQRFSVTISEKFAEGQPAVRATAGSCRILVAKSPAMGWDRDLIRRHATPTDQVFVVFRGRVYADQPTWLTVSDFLWTRFRRELGLTAQSSTVLAIIATTNCDAERLPWAEVV
jgi:hypothetical protein